MAARLEELDEVRARIDKVDRNLLSLLQERMELADQIAQAKHAARLPFRDAPREERVVRHVRRLAQEHQLEPDSVERIFRQLFEMAIARQQAHAKTLSVEPLRIAFVGTSGSWAELAARAHYMQRDGGVLLVGVGTGSEAAEEVRTSRADAALLSLESSLGGVSAQTMSLLASGDLYVTGEVVGALEHQLLCLPGVSLQHVETVLCDARAPLQCEAFFRAHPWLRAQVEPDAALAALRVKRQGDASFAVIASAEAGRHAGLERVDVELGAEPDQERFLEIARRPGRCGSAEACRTALLLSLPAEGGLTQLMEVLMRHRLRPATLHQQALRGGPPRLRFLLEVDSHAEAPSTAEAIEELRRHAPDLHLMGTYRALSRLEAHGGSRLPSTP